MRVAWSAARLDRDRLVRSHFYYGPLDAIASLYHSAALLNSIGEPPLVLCYLIFSSIMLFYIVVGTLFSECMSITNIHSIKSVLRAFSLPCIASVCLFFVLLPIISFAVKFLVFFFHYYLITLYMNSDHIFNTIIIYKYK